MGEGGKNEGLLPGLVLRPGERALWASRSSGVSGYSQTLVGLAILVLLPFFCVSSSVIRVFEHTVFRGESALIGAASLLLSFAMPALVLVVGLLVWALPRSRTTHLVTSERLVSRGLFGGLEELALADVRAVQRYVVTYRSRYGTREVVTDRLRIDAKGRSAPFLFGPSREIDRVEDLLEHGVLSRWIELGKLPSIDGSIAPAETHEEFFLCASTRTDGERYGPLFVGPRVIVRITEELSYHVLGRLYTLLGDAIDGETAEVLLRDVLRLPDTGHFVEMPRSKTRLELGPGSVVLRHGERTLSVRLSAAELGRLKKIAARPVSPPPEPEAHAPPTSADGELDALVAAPVPEAPRTPDLDDPSAMESAGRTLDLGSLPAALRTELTNALRADRAVASSPERVLSRHRALVMVACISPVLLFVVALAGYGAPCSPTQEWVWAVGYAAGLLLPIAALLLLALGAIRQRSLPFVPGTYVLPRDVLVARSSEIRIVPLAQVAAIGAPRSFPLSSVAEVTLWVENEPAEVLFVPNAEAAEVVGRLEVAQKAAQQAAAAARVSMPPGERRALSKAERRDPLADLRRSTTLEKARRSRPRSDLLAVFAVAGLVAVGLSVAALTARNDASDAASLAAAEGDVEALECYARGGGREAERARTELVPHAAFLEADAEHTVASYTRFLGDHTDAADAPLARARREEVAWETVNHDVWGLSAFVTSYPGSPHAAEARAVLPGLALAHAREEDDVPSYSTVVTGYPGTPEATEAARLRHGRYTDALAAITARGAAPEALAFFDRLFTTLEETSGGSEVLVRFRMPSSRSLTELDEALARTNGERIEPISPSFSRRASRLRESVVYDRLRAAFAGVVPDDVLPLDHASRLPDRPSEAEIEERIAEVPFPDEVAERARIAAEIDDPREVPEIRIDYEVLPTDTVYEMTVVGGSYDEPARLFAGFRVDFDIEMRLGLAPERHTLRFSVEPPERLSLSRSAGPPTAESVYEELASAAFDRLGAELSEALFGQATR